MGKNITELMVSLLDLKWWVNDMKNFKCPICGKRTKKDMYCSCCGMYIWNTFNYEYSIKRIDEYCNSVNIKYKFYKTKPNHQYVINQMRLKELIYRSFESNLGPTIDFIENVLKIESYEYLQNNKNISGNMAILFGYTSNIVPGLDKFKFYWNIRAIKEGYREQIEWAINDLENGYFVKKNHKAKKLRNLLRSQKN